MNALPTLPILPVSPTAWWSQEPAQLLAQQGVAVSPLGVAQGLSASQAATRLSQVGPNAWVAVSDTTLGRLMAKQLSSPLVLILVVGGAISLFVGEWMDALTILAIILISAGLGVAQEWRASRAVAALRERLALTCRVLRDGQLQSMPVQALVPGDVIDLSAGNLIPADGALLEARDFLVAESSLTGESFPVEKRPGTVPDRAALNERTNAVFQGSSVRSGTARVLVMNTGATTVMADLALRLTSTVAESDFSRGVRHFGEMLMRVMLVVVVLVLVANQWQGRPAMDSLLFAMALAVGLSPELLPVIVSVSLARGARDLASLGVWVKRLEAIEDLGGMDVLCTDKTGTLTTGVMTVEQALDALGQPCEQVLRLGYLNAAFETGIENPLDAALVSEGQTRQWHTAGWSLLCFSDPAKPDAAHALALLAERGIQVKMVTGDNRHVAAHVALAVGLDAQSILTGEQLSQMPEETLWHRVETTALFVEVDPSQKERIVRALQRTGHAVGYLGDGINDAPALHAADVGLSVEGAVDIARESADVVLLRPDLQVLRRGVEDGRRTFANTLKYIQITTSANFGNMVSMALATPLLPFLPLTATQILLNNFLSDLPSMAISSDRVDDHVLSAAQRWNVRRVRRFMVLFGLLSSVFDVLTFYLLVRVFGAGATLFHSAWFVVSVLTELAVVLVLRTRKPVWKSSPSRLLGVATVCVAIGVVLLPEAGALAAWLGLQPLPWPVMGSVMAILVAYIAATEAVKLWWVKDSPSPLQA
ncbi:MAG: HAD family hydrolase [Betaproteobacteria bacterium]|nr:HAD family hydrolase [Betaproteobacteria bacterium]